MYAALLSATLLVVALSACSVSPAAAPTTPAPAPAETAVPAISVSATHPQPNRTSPAAVEAATFPDVSRFIWAPVASGFVSPVDVQFPPDGSGRMFVVEQPGRVLIFDPEPPTSGAFLDLGDRVESAGNEQGLLGLAFHPQFGTNGIFFVNYTDRAHHDVIARFHISPDPRHADPTSERILLSVDDPFINHNGGVLAFGPDGFLYAGLGDGGGAGDPFGNAQNTGSLLGKVLRLDVDTADPYAIPAGNPFATGGGKPEVWAYGLRNPWRMSFDKSTGDLYIADVGQGLWEEVDVMPAGSPGGLNFGWNYREGLHPFAGKAPAGTQLTDPIAEYSHAEGGCSITGGPVYRGALPEWNGIYLYADYCSGKIWGLLPRGGNGSSASRSSRLLFETRAHITSFGQDALGEVYFADRAGGIFGLRSIE
jgi:glucose/arabinose dehydrogenase